VEAAEVEVEVRLLHPLAEVEVEEGVVGLLQTQLASAAAVVAEVVHLSSVPVVAAVHRSSVEVAAAVRSSSVGEEVVVRLSSAKEVVMAHLISVEVAAEVLPKLEQGEERAHSLVGVLERVSMMRVATLVRSSPVPLAAVMVEVRAPRVCLSEAVAAPGL
jgi:hypothetical protein